MSLCVYIRKLNASDNISRYSGRSIVLMLGLLLYFRCFPASQKDKYSDEMR